MGIFITSLHAGGEWCCDSPHLSLGPLGTQSLGTRYFFGGGFKTPLVTTYKTSVTDRVNSQTYFDVYSSILSNKMEAEYVHRFCFTFSSTLENICQGHMLRDTLKLSDLLGISYIL